MKTIQIDLFPQIDIEVYVGVTADSIKDIEERHGVNHDDLSGSHAFAIMFDDSDGHRRFVISLPNKCSATTLIHECLHMSWFIIEYTKIKINVHNHEMLTYLHTLLCTKTAECIGKEIILKNK